MAHGAAARQGGGGGVCSRSGPHGPGCGWAYIENKKISWAAKAIGPN
jgi:hypothetical protein